MELDAASEHGSLADSSYEIISESGTIENASVSSLASRSRSGSVVSDTDDEHPRLDASLQSVADDSPIDTPIASLALPPVNEDFVIYQADHEPLQLQKPFRIHYHGDEESQDAVVEKIAQAIAVSHSSDEIEDASSRFNVVQLSSFGEDKAAPQVTLIPSSGIELVVEACQACRLQKGRDEKVSHSLSFTDGHRPDLAVFCHRSDAPESSMAALSALTVEHGIATLDVAADLLRIKYPFTQTGDMRMVSRDEICLIDFRNFLEQDAMKLNRHIAYLLDRSEDYRAAALTDDLEEQKPEEFTLLALLSRLWDDIDSRIWLPPSSGITCVIMIGLMLLSVLIPRSYDPSAKGLSNGTSSGLASVPSIAGTGAPSVQTAVTSAPPKQGDWFPGPLGALSTISQSAILSMGAAEQAAPETEDPPVDLIHVKDWLYYVKMPNECTKSRRAPQIKVTASSDGKPVALSLAKWNSTVYSLELHPASGVGPVDVFVGFPGSARVYTYKLQPKSAWIAMKRLHSWVDRKSIESGIAACLASTKELSRVASKEVTTFRDQANGLVMSSSEWLQDHMEKIRSSGTTTAVDVWRNFELQTVAVTKALQKSNDDLSKSLSTYVETLTDSFNHHLKVLKDAKTSLGKDAVKTRHSVRRRVEALHKQFHGIASTQFIPENALATAHKRALSIVDNISECL